MGHRFVVRDDFHYEIVGTFTSRDEAMALVGRLRQDPNAEENRPPCTSWRTCRREYYFLEFDDSTSPWTELRSEPLFAVDFETGELWSLPPS